MRTYRSVLRLHNKLARKNLVKFKIDKIFPKNKQLAFEMQKGDKKQTKRVARISPL